MQLKLSIRQLQQYQLALGSYGHNMFFMIAMLIANLQIRVKIELCKIEITDSIGLGGLRSHIQNKSSVDSTQQMHLHSPNSNWCTGCLPGQHQNT